MSKEEDFLKDYLSLCKKYNKYLVCTMSGEFYIADLDEKLLGYQENDIRHDMEITRKYT